MILHKWRRFLAHFLMNFEHFIWVAAKVLMLHCFLNFCPNHLSKSLCLRDTEVLDTCLYTFFGSFLEMLDVSYTKVSAAALAHIVCRNPSFKRLIFRDCKNGVQEESDNTETLYFQLGKLCKLKEISVGWGFSFFSLQAIKPAISMLRAINVGIGATVGEDGVKLISKISPLQGFTRIRDSLFSGNIGLCCNRYGCILASC